jgi:NAD/NADP transhydrogenase alpha subunit
MFVHRIIMPVLFTIVITSSFVVISGFAGAAFAAKKVANYSAVSNTMVQPHTTENTNSLNSQNAYVDDSTRDTANFAKDLKKFSKCLTGVAADGDLSLIEVTECYHQVF